MNRVRLAVKLVFLLAALWSLAVGTVLLLRPVQVRSVAAVSPGSDAQSPTVESEIEYRSWYEVQGAWGVVVLAIFALLYGTAAVLIWRSQHIGGAVFALAAVFLTGLAGFSIGPAYAPAALAVLIGMAVLGGAELMSRSRS